MEKEIYQKVANIGLRGSVGDKVLSIPLYAKTSELNAKGFLKSQEELMHNVSSIMMKCYEKQMSEYIAQKKKSTNLMDN